MDQIELLECNSDNSVDHINSALFSAWKGHEGLVIRKSKRPGYLPTTDVERNKTCLSEHFANEPEQPKFYVKFTVPYLEFLCNHEAVLTINISDFNTKGERPGPNERSLRRFSNTTVKHKILTVVAHRELGIKLPFLVKYSTGIQGNEEGQKDNDDDIARDEMAVHTLDLKMAKVIVGPFEETISKHRFDDNVKGALLRHIKDNYLLAFENAGYHKHHPPADHDNLSETTTEVDYTHHKIKGRQIYIDHVHDVPISEINDYLNTLWTEYNNVPGDLLDDDSILRAHFPSDWVNEVNFGLRLTSKPPCVQPMCTSEIALHINIQAGLLSNGYKPSNPSAMFGIAFVVSVERVEDKDGTRLSLNLLEGRRFRKVHSTGVPEEPRLIQEIERFGKSYFEQLQRLDCPVIYKKTRGGAVEECTHQCSHAYTASHILRRQVNVNLCGFDTMTTISQQSINTHFEVRYKRAIEGGSNPCHILAKWSFKGGAFGATFGRAPMIQLITSESSTCNAILYVFVDKGHLYLGSTTASHTPQSGVRRNFSQWRIALGLTLSLSGSSSDRTILNFENAHVVRELSYLYRASKWEEQAFSVFSPELVQAYVDDLRDQGVLYSVSTNRKVGHFQLRPRILPSYCISSNYLEGDHIVVCNDAAVVLFGMVGDHKLPSSPLIDTSEVETYISRRVFLERVLQNLSHVNERTKLVITPNFALFGSEESFLQISSVDLVNKGTGLQFAWKLQGSSDGYLRYSWISRDEWRYEHAGDFVHPQEIGSYSIVCITHNELRLPLVDPENHACKVKLSANIKLSVSRKRIDGKGQWSGETSVNWSDDLSLEGNASGGVSISISGSRLTPALSGPHFSGELGREIYNSVHTQLSKVANTIDLTGIVAGVQSIFDDCWVGPRGRVVKRVAFNLHGDLRLVHVAP